MSNSRLGARLADDLFHLAAGADRHGRFGHDHRIAGQRPGDFLGGGEDIGQIGMAVSAAAGRADGDEDRVALRRRPFRDRFRRTAVRLCTLAATTSSRPGSKIGMPPLRRVSTLACVLVDADDLMAELRQAGARYKPHIARADHRDAHGLSCEMRFLLA